MSQKYLESCHHFVFLGPFAAAAVGWPDNKKYVNSSKIFNLIRHKCHIKHANVISG